MSDHVCKPDQAAIYVEQMVRIGKALSDPIRIRMLGLFAQGRGCCGLPPVSSLPIPGADESEGICVGELEQRYNLAQSKVSYHLRVLREAGLLVEEVRGKWTFYSLNRDAVRCFLGQLAEQLQLD